MTQPKMNQSRNRRPLGEQTAVQARALVLTIGIAAGSGCAATTYTYRAGDNRVGDAIGEPLRDSGWTRQTPPDVLLHAVEAPYKLPENADCTEIRSEIAALDLVLGPDLDVVDTRKDPSDLDVSGLVSSAIGGVVGLPFRSIVRRLSGATGRERDLVKAILAGMVRRAFLKGVAHQTCATPPSSPRTRSDPPIAAETRRGDQPKTPQ